MEPTSAKELRLLMPRDSSSPNTIKSNSEPNSSNVIVLFSTGPKQPIFRINGRPSWQPEPNTTPSGKNTPFILRKNPASFTEIVDEQSQIPDDYIILEKTQSKDSPSMDRFGFTIGSRNSTRKVTKKLLKQDALREDERIENWSKILPSIDSLIQKKCPNLKSLIRKGIPDSLRVRVWPLLANIEAVKLSHPRVDFEELAANTDKSAALEEIKKDLDRTFPDHHFFQKEEGQRSLERVLKAISLIFKDLGYCQGLNFVCAILVMHCNEEDAFWIMVSLLTNYGLLELYKNPNTIKRDLFILDKLIGKRIPRLKSHFETNDLDALHFGISWWMTLFSAADGIPFPIAVRAMDILLHENRKTLFRVALNILKLKENELLLINGLEDLIPCLRQGLTETIYEEDDDLFFKLMSTITVTNKEIKQLEVAYSSISNK